MRLLTALETREREKASDTIEILMFHRVFYSEVQLKRERLTRRSGHIHRRQVADQHWCIGQHASSQEQDTSEGEDDPGQNYL